MKINRTIVILVVFFLLWSLLGFVTKNYYDEYLPGVPDSGRWPIASLVWLLAPKNIAEWPWDDVSYAVVWSWAVATLLLPALVPMLLARFWIERAVAWSCFAMLTTWALYTTFDVQYGYVRIFKWPRTTSAAFWFVFKPMLWAGASCILGLVIGLFLRKMVEVYKAKPGRIYPDESK